MLSTGAELACGMLRNMGSNALLSRRRRSSAAVSVSGSAGRAGPTAVSGAEPDGLELSPAPLVLFPLGAFFRRLPMLALI